jgi:hypothetical protein
MLFIKVGFQVKLPKRVYKLSFQFSKSRVKTSYVTKEE